MAATTTSRLLLDTHTFIWWRAAQSRVGAEALRAIAEAETVYVSMASAWEAAVKISIGKLRLDSRFEEGISESGFRSLPIAFGHIDRLETLPFLHRDPFDRMLIAQALADDLTIVTADRQITRYEVSWLPASA